MSDPNDPHPGDVEKVGEYLHAAYTHEGHPIPAQFLRERGFRWDDGYVEACLDALVDRGDADERDDGFLPLDEGGEVPPTLDELVAKSDE